MPKSTGGKSMGKGPKNQTGKTTSSGSGAAKAKKGRKRGKKTTSTKGY